PWRKEKGPNKEIRWSAPKRATGGRSTSEHLHGRRRSEPPIERRWSRRASNRRGCCRSSDRPSGKLRIIAEAVIVVAARKRPGDDVAEQADGRAGVSGHERRKSPLKIDDVGGFL
ncbi:hypothetical protein Dimus_035533, partial [Dionaea muscipula]